MSKWPPVLLVALLGTAAVTPVLWYGIPSNIDLGQHYSFALCFYHSILAGNFSPSWLADSNYGFGDPSIRFYPPALYYVFALVRVATGDWYNASLIVFAVLSVTGCLGIYFWASTIFDRRTAMWGGMAYAFMPYRLNELYQTFLLAEYAGGAVLPFCFAFVERVCQRGRWRDVAALAAAYSILIFTHLPLSVIGSLSLFIYALLRMRANNRKGLLGLQLTIAVCLALSASACYWATMATEMAWLKMEDVTRYYKDNFIFSSFSPDYLNIWWMNYIAVATLAMVIPVVAMWLSTREAPPRSLMMVALTFLFSLLMATVLSDPLWRAVPGLIEVQFPWRWMTVVSMTGSLLAAPGISFWLSKAKAERREIALIILGSVIISISFSLSHIVREAQYLSRTKFNEVIDSVPNSKTNNYLLPSWASTSIEKMAAEVDAGPRSVSIESWKPEQRTFQVGPGPPVNARIRTFFYPLWVANAGGRLLPTRPALDGALLITLPAEAITVDINFREPQRRQISAFLSLIGWSLITLIFIFSTKTTRKCF